MKSLHSYPTRGFTLIEVVIALAVLGIGLTVVIELFSGGLRLGKISEEYVKAASYGSMKIEEILSKDQMAEGVEEGRIDEHYRWQMEVEKVNLFPSKKSDDFKLPVELLQIKVDVIWKSGLKERSMRVETYKVVKAIENE